MIRTNLWVSALAEQSAIATVLSNMDAELAALEATATRPARSSKA